MWELYLGGQDPLESLDGVALRPGGAPQPEEQPQTGGVTLLLGLDVASVATEAHPAGQSPPALTDLRSHTVRWREAAI